MQIDALSYRKDTIHPQRWGYQTRGGAMPSSVIIHTTSNKRATQFDTEATFIRDSPDISAHFLIGKDGRIVQFLDPKQWQAWHAGAALPNWVNAKSIGIEHHVSVGEEWTAAQEAACTWLVRQLMTDYGIPSDLIDTHRAVALPKGRKSDPAGWNDVAFYAWRAALANSPPPPVTRYRVKGTPVFQDQPCKGVIALYLNPGMIVEVDKVYPDGTAHLATGAGFIRLDQSVEALP